MVPKDWQHPKDADGSFIPLLVGDYRVRADDWCEQLRWWMDGDTDKIEYFAECHAKNPIDTIERFIEFAGPPPQQKDYMPLWLNAAADHYMMYENTSEGTPISPAMPTAEDLADWLFNNGASAKEALHVIETLEKDAKSQAAIIKQRGEEADEFLRLRADLERDLAAERAFTKRLLAELRR